MKKIYYVNFIYEENITIQGSICFTDFDKANEYGLDVCEYFRRNVELMQPLRYEVNFMFLS